jgi:hypothetical protein
MPITTNTKTAARTIFDLTLSLLSCACLELRFFIY